jgi:hypothetical protein
LEWWRPKVRNAISEEARYSNIFDPNMEWEIDIRYQASEVHWNMGNATIYSFQSRAKDPIRKIKIASKILDLIEDAVNEYDEDS